MRQHVDEGCNNIFDEHILAAGRLATLQTTKMVRQIKCNKIFSCSSSYLQLGCQVLFALAWLCGGASTESFLDSNQLTVALSLASFDLRVVSLIRLFH
jgi:hypothetical protein